MKEKPQHKSAATNAQRNEDAARLFKHCPPAIGALDKESRRLRRLQARKEWKAANP